jgi:hypothetical protein
MGYILLRRACKTTSQHAKTAIVSAALFCTVGFVDEIVAAPKWSGSGQFRIIVEVPPVAGVERPDELVASCHLEFAEWLQRSHANGSADLQSLQVHRIESGGEVATRGVAFDTARSPYDRPCRYDDELYPRTASRVGRASETTDGRAALVVRDREARLFNREHQTNRGRLIWSHRQEGNETTRYAIYFDVLPQKRPWAVPSAPWIGDGDVLRREGGSKLGGFSHFTAAPGDLNGDGLFDIVAGNEKGDLFWFPNRGPANRPDFVGCQFLTDELGPIDAGWYAAPVMYDWDSDGLTDLLVGTSGNVILWWRNLGARTSPRFEYRGFVEADGKRLEVPEQPVAEDSHGIFARDYFNQPWIGDVDSDGTIDLLTGGYTTGRIFWYRSAGRNAEGTPELRYVGELRDASGPIDTIWAAAPALADFDRDGRIDLVTGAWWWSGIQRQPKQGETDLLWYFRGGRRGEDILFNRAAFPALGALPNASIARPNVFDANGDGLLDLFVSESGGDAFIFLNVGSKTEPKWDLRSKPLSIPWGFERHFDLAASIANVDGDGSPEFLVGNVLSSITGAAATPRMKTLGAAHVDGQSIRHEGPGYGDPYYYSILYDWDGDKHADILWGTQQGNVYLHRSRASDDPLAFHEGTLMRLAGGEPLRVGPPVVRSADEASDFTILQGSRIVLNVADFDADGVADLLIGDTFSNLWIFRGTTPGAIDAFHPAELLAKLSTRPESIECADWDNDGLVDLLIGGTAVEPCVIYYNASQPARPEVKPAHAVENLPYLFWGPKLRAADWNRDGDVDLLVQSEFFSFWLERSFLEHGYQVAKILSADDGRPIIEEKSKPGKAQ